MSVGRTGGGPSAFTNSHRTVFRGEDVVLRCEPPETPSFVLWRKGDDPQRSPVLIKQKNDGSLSGSCDGSCGMGSNYSLIIRNVQIADEGIYICVFKDLHGFIKYSLTNLTIHDHIVTTMTTPVKPTDMENDGPGSGWMIGLGFFIVVVKLVLLCSATVFCGSKSRRRQCWPNSNTLLPLRLTSCLVNSHGPIENVSGRDSEDTTANDATLPITARQTSDNCYSFNVDLHTCESGRDILEYFIESGLHPFEKEYALWSLRTGTIIVCIIRQTDGNPHKVLMREFQFGAPAQEDIMESIKREISTETRDITMYTNFSPCNTNEYKFRWELWKLKVDLELDLKLVFPAFYIDIRRPTCDSCKHPRHPRQESQRNFQELQALSSKPFEEKDWDDLMDLLMKFEQQEKGVSEDLYLLRYGQKYGRWRNWGDEQMKKDFIALSEGF